MTSLSAVVLHPALRPTTIGQFDRRKRYAHAEEPMEYEFTVVVERDEDGAYIAICPALPGCHTAGDTEEEALELIEDAIRLPIEARLELGERA